MTTPITEPTREQVERAWQKTALEQAEQIVFLGCELKLTRELLAAAEAKLAEATETKAAESPPGGPPP